ncbi:guanine nucleotide-binding protein alpha-1 subunit [[Candida] railenensis]|uniref:Guanine nucleotide-binding protein alpha-1 subunit n=1 Tax=[Candida] railenensis TaxID=45579 RepID=A0A9P0QNJ8_9ASCO|nr:guanine nucleotide-binding protein alpha-1 subunit [[Candida] railenensis]
MGCATSTLTEETSPLFQERKINDIIEQQLLARKRNEKAKLKLLLLGAGESGKSTVLKQLRLLHQGGFTQPERIQYAQIVWVDLIQSMKILIIQARKRGIELDCDQPGNPLNSYKQLILRIDPLHQIETNAAGGSNFLNDYVVKYSENFKQRRTLNSSGKLSGFDESVVDSESQDFSVETLTDELRNVSTFQVAEPDRFKVARAISKLWTEDSGIKKVYDISNEFQLETNTSYYFDNASKFADPDYILSDLDILKGRIKTTGITETDFNINSFNFKVLDAGGQRSERKKWIHCFEDVTAIFFVVALSEYDQFLFEDERVNRMHEAIILFDSLCNSKWFVNTPFILFLNKMDLFEEKLKKSPLHYHFPEYKGDPKSVEEATKYFTDLFLSLNRTRKPIYVHRTCATDTKSMKFVLAAVTDVIIQQNLANSGII